MRRMARSCSTSCAFKDARIITSFLAGLAPHALRKSFDAFAIPLGEASHAKSPFIPHHGAAAHKLSRFRGPPLCVECCAASGGFLDCLVKQDVKPRTRDWSEKDCFPGEPVFAKRQPGAETRAFCYRLCSTAKRALFPSRSRRRDMQNARGPMRRMSFLSLHAIISPTRLSRIAHLYEEDHMYHAIVARAYASCSEGSTRRLYAHSHSLAPNASTVFLGNMRLAEPAGRLQRSNVV